MSKFDNYADNIDKHIEIGEPTFGWSIETLIKLFGCKGYHCDCPTGEAIPKCQFCGRSLEQHNE